MVGSRVSRRALLGAGAATAAALLGGCERSEPAPPGFGLQESATVADLSIAAVLADYLTDAARAYDAAAPAPGPSGGEFARKLAAASRAQREALLRAVHTPRLQPGAADTRPLPGKTACASTAPRRGGMPAAGERTRPTCAAAVAQDRLIAQLIDALPKVSDPALRTTVAAILAGAAEQAALLARARGLAAAPSAFVRGQA